MWNLKTQTCHTSPVISKIPTRGIVPSFLLTLFCPRYQWICKIQINPTNLRDNGCNYLLNLWDIWQICKMSLCTAAIPIFPFLASVVIRVIGFDIMFGSQSIFIFLCFRYPSLAWTDPPFMASCSTWKLGPSGGIFWNLWSHWNFGFSNCARGKIPKFNQRY